MRVTCTNPLLLEWQRSAAQDIWILRNGRNEIKRINPLEPRWKKLGIYSTPGDEIKPSITSIQGVEKASGGVGMNRNGRNRFDSCLVRSTKDFGKTQRITNRSCVSVVKRELIMEGTDRKKSEITDGLEVSTDQLVLLGLVLGNPLKDTTTKSDIWVNLTHICKIPVCIMFLNPCMVKNLKPSRNQISLIPY
mmetsp:Transcript_2612/g.6938  ORF Transcript_2612/g.6938 Transcript_2612/m.6938 type:complete len:192 (-) Transcript_2612:17-592(-)